MGLKPMEGAPPKGPVRRGATLEPAMNILPSPRFMAAIRESRPAAGRRRPDDLRVDL